MYMVMESNGYAYESVRHTQWLSLEEANKLAKDLSETFEDLDFWVESHLDEKPEPEQEERYYNENAVDGWEDMFPDRDDY
jgi:hypothetical protein